MKRYTEIGLPSRKFIPGEGIHPDKDPKGPHIPDIPTDGEAFDDENWFRSKTYLYAIDLFNSEYWWETHEVLEKLWVRTGKTTQVGEFIKGIIQISAALLKDSQSLSGGASKLIGRGLPKLRQQKGEYLGINVSEFAGEIEDYFSSGSATQQKPKIQLVGFEK